MAIRKSELCHVLLTIDCAYDAINRIRGLKR
nr:MAG TPA: hypothetical protein [Caudoviricetes sp.]